MKTTLFTLTLFAGLILSLSGCRSGNNSPGHSIVIGNQDEALCGIIAGKEDRIAARSLQKYFLKKYNLPVDILDPGDGFPEKLKCAILLGRAKTNALLRKIAAENRVQVGADELTADGYVVKTIKNRDIDYILAAGGGKPGVFYAVGEMKHYYIRKNDDAVIMLPADVREKPVFKYRWLWTWDWRMEWGATEPGGSKMGGGGTYRKAPGSFLADYKKCIDYMSENGLNGLIIWGFVRDSHGGVEASQELCRYADDRGVTILPGVGTSGYSGYVFEGDHPFNIRTWLKEHPELRSVDKDGKTGGTGVDGLTDHLCPSKKANQEWLDDGAKWLFETFKIGGVNLEMGDHFVCYCDECKCARAAIKSGEPDYYKDMAISHSRTLQTMHKLAPDAWLSYATYTGFTREMMTDPPKFIEMIPPYAICQWTLTHMMDSTFIPDSMDPASGKGWPEGVKPMTEHSVGYLHWANKSTGTEDDFYLERLHRAARLSLRSGLEGLVLYGELPDSRVNMELNYLAFREYCFHPGLSREAFTEKRLAPMYGVESTGELWKIIEMVRMEKQRNTEKNRTGAQDIARKAFEASAAPYRDHWRDLIAYLKSLKQK